MKELAQLLRVLLARSLFAKKLPAFDVLLHGVRLWLGHICLMPGSSFWTWSPFELFALCHYFLLATFAPRYLQRQHEYERDRRVAESVRGSLWLLGIEPTLYLELRDSEARWWTSSLTPSRTERCISPSVSRTVRHGSDVFAVGAELSDWQSGDFHIIREYVAHSEVGLLTFTGEWRQSQIRLLESG